MFRNIRVLVKAIVVMAVTGRGGGVVGVCGSECVYVCVSVKASICPPNNNEQT